MSLFGVMLLLLIIFLSVIIYYFSISTTFLPHIIHNFAYHKLQWYTKFRREYKGYILYSKLSTPFHFYTFFT
jgi:hypothetical protein